MEHDCESLLYNLVLIDRCGPEMVFWVTLKSAGTKNRWSKDHAVTLLDMGYKKSETLCKKRS